MVEVTPKGKAFDRISHERIMARLDWRSFVQGILPKILHSHKLFLLSSLFIIVGWSCLCTWWTLDALEHSEPGSTGEQWLEWLIGAGNRFRVAGILFVFAVVFRFNRCYDRWWEGRVLWERIITASLDLGRMNRAYISDDEYADRFSRFIVVFAYTCKALLRGNPLAHPLEAGEELIRKGYLTREELDDMADYETSQPHYCLEMLTAILVESYFPEKALVFDANHKTHSQILRGLDSGITRMGTCIGAAIRVHAAGLPESYDAMQYLIFYFYFFLAPIFFAPTVGWALPILLGFESLIIMLIVAMGTALVDPFGDDKVDLPLNLFCLTIETSIAQIDQRAKRRTLKRLARTSNSAIKVTINSKLE